VTLPASPTLVDFPSGAVTSIATVLHRERRGDQAVLLLDRTAAHPVDRAWPDQGADRGMLSSAGVEAVLLDCVVAATDGGSLFLGADVPVRKGTEGWTFLVAHLVYEAAPFREGDSVRVDIDEAYRTALSVGHTACHLASLALNRALAIAWTKEVPSDSLGAPNFDAVAIETSTILENGSRDEYRIGKSLRRKGFSTAALDDLAAAEGAVRATLDAWIGSAAAVRIERQGDAITDRRDWLCEIESGARIPCGGTHVASLADLAGLTVRLERRELEGAMGLTMWTSTAG